MSDNIEAAKKIINTLTVDEQRAVYAYLRAKVAPHPLESKWETTADIIMGAINRSADITQRGIRGIIAEAAFEAEILPGLQGWENVKVEGEQPYDFRLRELQGGASVTIQIKLQRTEGGVPKKGTKLRQEYFIVEVQRTRTGTTTVPAKPVAAKPGEITEIVKETTVKTRPYSFGDFDLLAVNMHPSTRNWSRFMYTVAAWLIPRKTDAKLIDIMQPVSATRTDVWTDNLQECITWFKSGEKRIVYQDPPETAPPEKASR
jgi:hypothetical protein